MFATIGDLNVHYEREGRGTPIVLVHGIGSMGSAFEEMLPLLATGHTAYSYDLRGFGSTQRPAAPKLSHEVWADDLKRFMDHLGMDKAVVVGWSLGGRIASGFTAKHPHRVERLVLLGPAIRDMVEGDYRLGFWPANTEPEVGANRFQERLKMIDAGATAAEVVDKTFDLTRASGFSPATLVSNPHAVEKVRQEHLANDPKAYAEAIRGHFALNSVPLAKRPAPADITCPTLIVVGDAERKPVVEAALILNALLPKSSFKVIPHCGHHYGFEQPHATCDAIRRFLATPLD